MNLIPRSPRKLSLSQTISTSGADKNLFVYLLLIVLMLAACTPAEEEPQADSAEDSSSSQVDGSSDSSEPESQSSLVIDEDDSSNDQSSTIQEEAEPVDPVSPEAGWGTSSHADSYVLSSMGRNDTCSRCHSPVEWLPGPEDIPESCLTCKFDVDEPEPMISEEDWGHVPCKTCHKVKDGEVNPEYIWLDIAVIDEYLDVDSPDELCAKCHEETAQPEHKPAVKLSEDHQELGCTECHDAHSTATGCLNSDCHPETGSSNDVIVGHDDDHAIVSCTACHDANNLQVGPAGAEGVWTTLVEVSREGEEQILSHSSHSIQADVDCERCHFQENPWGLAFDVSPSP